MKQTFLTGNKEKEEKIKISDDFPGSEPEVSIKIEDTNPVQNEAVVVPQATQNWTCHYIMTVLTTVICLGPFSIAGLMYFLKARREARGGDLTKARNSKYKAVVWSSTAVLFGLTAAAIIVFGLLFYRPNFHSTYRYTTGFKPTYINPYADQRRAKPDEYATVSIDDSLDVTTVVPEMRVWLFSTDSIFTDTSPVFNVLQNLGRFMKLFGGLLPVFNSEASGNSTDTVDANNITYTWNISVTNMSEPVEAVDFYDPPQDIEFETNTTVTQNMDKPVEAVDLMLPRQDMKLEANITTQDSKASTDEVRADDYWGPEIL